MKECINCGELKVLSEFYKHSGMLDGHINKCKNCCKLHSKIRYDKLKTDPDFIEKQRVRSMEKYHRLNYKDRQVEWSKDRPWTQYSVYKNLNRDLKLEKGLEAHHWCYKNEYLTDVFIMHKHDHKHLHTYISFDLETKLFYITKTRDMLDSRKKHIDFIKYLGLKFSVP